MFDNDLEDGREDIDKIDEPAAALALIGDRCDLLLYISSKSNNPAIIKLFICDLCIITLYKMP